MPISLHNIAEHRRDIEFTYREQVAHIAYSTDTATKEFAADALRIQREALKQERRRTALEAIITMVQAPDGTQEAMVEDEAAEAAIRQLLTDSDQLKASIDRAILTVVLEWDLIDDHGDMVPLDAEHIAPVPAEFEGAIISAILSDVQMGEARGAKPLTPLPSPLKPKAKQATSRPHRNGMAFSKRVSGVQR